MLLVIHQEDFHKNNQNSARESFQINLHNRYNISWITSSNAAISKMNVREYAKYEEEIDKAVREGRIQP